MSNQPRAAPWVNGMSIMRPIGAKSTIIFCLCTDMESSLLYDQRVREKQTPHGNWDKMINNQEVNRQKPAKKDEK